VKFGEPTPDRKSQVGLAARQRIQAMLRDRGQLQAAFILSDVLGRPMSDR
jgi:hypothetical protein